MLTKICFGLVLLAAMPAWAQVEPSATGPPQLSDDEMLTPPPVSGEIYPMITGSETWSNEVRFGLNLEGAYDDNVIGFTSTTPVSDFTYTIRPAIALDRLTPRLHETFAYNPGFTLYQHTTARNEADQNVAATIEYRLSPHTSINVRDSFLKSTNVFNQPFAGVTGSTSPSVETVVAPFADQISNEAGALLSHQYSRNGMIGASGTYAVLSYPNPSQASGLTNSNAREGSAFYNLRLTNTQYIGMTYRYSKMIAESVRGDSEAQTNTIYFFYTFHLKPSLSISASGGPQYFSVVEAPLPASASWTPAIAASMGWQRSRTSLSASFVRTISGNAGLIGAYRATGASLSARWRFTRFWSGGVSTSYAIAKNVTSSAQGSNPGGHSISGIASLEHPIGERFTTEFGYARLHQSYSGLSVISQFPDSDREFISVSYQLTRPLGR